MWMNFQNCLLFVFLNVTSLDFFQAVNATYYIEIATRSSCHFFLCVVNWLSALTSMAYSANSNTSTTPKNGGFSSIAVFSGQSWTAFRYFQWRFCWHAFNLQHQLMKIQHFLLRMWYRTINVQRPRYWSVSMVRAWEKVHWHTTCKCFVCFCFQ